MTETVQIPASLLDRFMAFFDKHEEPENKPDPEPEVPEEYKAAVVERDQYKAELEQFKAEAGKQARVDQFAAELKETKANGELAEMLAAMDEATATRIMQEFKALSAQIKESALLEEVGTEAPNDTNSPAEALNAAILARATEKGVAYPIALAQLRNEKPELFEALKEK